MAFAATAPVRSQGAMRDPQAQIAELRKAMVRVALPAAGRYQIKVGMVGDAACAGEVIAFMI